VVRNKDVVRTSDPNGIRTRVTAVKGRYYLFISCYIATTYGCKDSLLRQKLRKTLALPPWKLRQASDREPPDDLQSLRLPETSATLEHDVRWLRRSTCCMIKGPGTCRLFGRSASARQDWPIKDVAEFANSRKVLPGSFCRDFQLLL
jgi:hypothetical protein